MSYITTYTLKHFDPLEPNIDLIDIKDIAHALSLLCRANGHCRHFYSVAQHCMACSNEAKARGYNKRIQLACLLHDGSEAYLSDITRPVKKELKYYLDVEENLQSMIWHKWIETPLNNDEIKMIFDVDDTLLYYEFKALIGEELFDIAPLLISKPNFGFIDFNDVERNFLSFFENLINE